MSLQPSILTQSLHSITIPNRNLYLKLSLLAILLLRSRLLVPVSKLSPTPAEGSSRAKEKGKETKGGDGEGNDDSPPLLYDEDSESGTKTLWVPFRGKKSKVKIALTPASYLASTRVLFPPLYPPGTAPTTLKPSKSQTAQLISLLRLAFPSVRSKQAMLLLLHSAFLVLRTYLSVLVAKLDGRIVRDLVSADAPGFGRGIILWFLLAIPSTYTNSMLRHVQSKLSLLLRTRLTRYAHDLYLAPAPLLRYYRISHGAGRERLDGVDQYIASDIAAFCDSLSALYGNVMKPSLDIIIFTSQLARSLGTRGTLLLFLNYYVTARILRAVTPAFGRLAAVERGLEGEFRAGMGRVGRESEEVAFYNGGPRERTILWRAYLRLVKHINSIYKIRIAYEWTEDFVIKYAWSAAGYILISIPILLTRRRRSVGVQTGLTSPMSVNDAIAERTENYISSRRLLLSLADAGGRLMYAYKDVLELVGLGGRVYTLFSVLHGVGQHGPQEHTLGDKEGELGGANVTLPGSGDFRHSETKVALRGVDILVPGEGLTLVRGLTFELEAMRGKEGEDNHEMGGNEREETEGDFEPVTESGESVLEEEGSLTRNGATYELDVSRNVSEDRSRAGLRESGERDEEIARMHPGEHLLITGANGVGKTAIARVIAGLWPVVPAHREGDTAQGSAMLGEGILERPERGVGGVFVVPQRAYMVVGSLVDQIIYPHTYIQFLSSKRNMEELMDILRIVHLAYLPGREGWGGVKEWGGVLSGGERQRMGMARVFYHRPKFAVLDECTSAVSSDVEGSMYQHAKDIGITLITISLRPSLAKYHTRQLTLHGDGTGEWTLTRVGTAEERMGIDREIVRLEEELRAVEGWEGRVRVLEGLLGVGGARVQKDEKSSLA